MRSSILAFVLIFASTARAESRGYAELLDAARVAMLRGSYAAARDLLDQAERASTSASTPLSTGDVARLPFYRGAVEWYAGNRDEASLRHWRAAWAISLDLQPDAQLLPDSQARDVFYALRGEVRSGEQVPLALPEDTTVFIDGARPEASDTLPAGRHLVQVRCPSGSFASTWHTFGPPPPDYLTVCTAGSYGAAAESASDPLDALCPALPPAELERTVARAREALFAEDIAAFQALDADLHKRLPCMRSTLVEPEQWAPHLVSLSIAAYARNGDWQTPLAAALAALPNVSRAVGPTHPIGAWVAPPPPAAVRSAPAGAEVYVDGRRVAYLPPLIGPHLVQLRDGRQFVTRYLQNGEADTPWDELLAPFSQEAPVVVAPPPVRRSSGARVGLVIGGGVLAAGGGSLLAVASIEKEALLGDERQLRQWSLAGETAETVTDDPAVQRINTLYISGFASAGVGLALGVFGLVVPLSVTSVEGTPAVLYSGAW